MKPQDYIIVRGCPNRLSFQFLEREYGTLHGRASGCSGLLVRRDETGTETEEPIKLFEFTGLSGGWDAAEDGLLDMIVETNVPGFERAAMLLKPAESSGLIYLP